MPSKVSPVTVRCRPPDAGVPGVEMRGESVLQPGVTRPGNARAEPLPGVLPLNLTGVLNSSAPAVPRLPRLGWRVIVSIIAREGDAGACGETPPAASSSLQDWLALFANGTAHVFAGVDDARLAEAAFYRLRMPGALLLSGRPVNLPGFQCSN